MAAKKKALGLKGAVKAPRTQKATPPLGKSAVNRAAGKKGKTSNVQRPTSNGGNAEGATFHSFDDVRDALKKQGGGTDG